MNYINAKLLLINDLFNSSSSPGMPGGLGFGVGICPDDYSNLNIEPLPGYDDITRVSYGNYIHVSSGSIMCWIPAFKYRVNDKFNNSVQIWDPKDPSCPENAILHRAFINGGKRVNGFFCDKYICSPDANNTMGISVKNGSVLSLTAKNTDGNYTAQLANCVGQLDDAITASIARGKGFQCMSVFQLGALRLLILAHAQASVSSKYNAWFDVTGNHNLPYGNTSNLKDPNYPSTTWDPDRLFHNKGLTGSCSVFAKSTHNGQDSGVADLKGIVYQVATGYIGSWSYYFLKPEVDITSLDKDAMYNNSNYDSFTMPFTGWQGWDTSQPMFSNDDNGINYNCCGFLNTITNTGNQKFIGMFEQDQCFISNATSSFPCFGCDYISSGLNFGLFYTNLGYNRSIAHGGFGFRACGYL